MTVVYKGNGGEGVEKNVSGKKLKKMNAMNKKKGRRKEHIVTCNSGRRAPTATRSFDYSIYIAGRMGCANLHLS